MTIPFRDHHHDADRLDEMLDAMRAGQETTGEPSGLADAARRIREMADRAAGAAPEATFDAIWEDLMHAHAVATPMSSNRGATRAVPRETHRVPEARGLPEMGRWQGLLAAAIVMLVLVGMVAAAWTLRDGGGTPEDDRAGILSAPTALDATPGASPEANVDWTALISTAECVPPEGAPRGIPMARGATARTDVAYTPLSEADGEDAVAAARVARSWDACFAAETGIPLDRYGFIGSGIPETYEERASRVQEAGKAVSAEYPIDDTGEFFVFTNEDPADTGTANLVFQPEHAVTLADGRLLIPGTWVISVPFSMFIHEAPPNFITQAVVMEKIDGTWMLWDHLPVCIGDCEGMWPEISPYVSEYSSIDNPQFAGMPPGESGPWTAWVTPEECTAEPVSADDLEAILSGTADHANRSYAVAGPASPETAQAAVDAARAWHACGEYGPDGARHGLETDAYIRLMQPNQTELQPGFLAQLAERGQEVSAHLESLSEDDLRVATTVEPPRELLDEWAADAMGPVPFVVSQVYKSQAALVLDDGRVLVLEATLRWEGHPARPTVASAPSPDDHLSGQVVILANQDGMWRVDDTLPVCKGNCDAFWAEFANPFGIPNPAPVADVEWLSWVTPQECTAEPMTTEEYAEVMREEPDISGRSYEVVGPADPTTAADAAMAARAQLSCVAYGNADEARSLQTDAYTFFQSASASRTTTNEELQEQMFLHSMDLSLQFPTMEAGAMVMTIDEEPHPDLIRSWREQGVPAGGGFFHPAYDPAQVMSLADGRVAIPATLLWWRLDGPDGTPVTNGEPISTQLAVMQQVDGQWKVDEMLNLCYAEECVAMWEQMGLLPIATPMASPEG